MRKRYMLWLTPGLLAVAPLAHQTPGSPPCSKVSDPTPGTYPDHQLSPKESLNNYEVVFLGEVAVPARACSIGWCAGIKVLRTIKGTPPPSNIVQVLRPPESQCAPRYFGAKGSRWVVFANFGTSKGGQPYLYAEEQGPSFISNQLPDFASLESNFQRKRAALDQAISRRLGSTL